MVLESVQTIDSAQSPALVLVFNKCDLDEEFDVEKTTANFFANVENEDIKRFYSEIKCICIPHQDSVKKVKAPGSIFFSNSTIF